MKKLKFALLCLPLISLPSLAAPKDTTTISLCSLEETYFIRQIKRESTNKSGKPELGAMTVAAFAVSKEVDGPQIGLTVSRILDLDLADVTPGPSSMKETTVTNFLPEGNVVSVQVTDHDREKLADFTRPIVGGTGKYMGANGVSYTKRIVHTDHPVYKITLKLIVPCAK